MSTVSILILVALLAFISPAVQGKKIFCYYSSFAHRRHGVGHFLPEDIDPHLCTHIIYAFVDITPDGRDLMPYDQIDVGPKGLYARTLALKEKNPSLKVLLAVGGWQIGSMPFIPVVRTEESRREWIQNVVRYVRKHGFDGFDMDWEFPATRGSPPEDKYKFTQLMKGLYEAFAREAAQTGREKLLLTLATASGTYYIDQSYETDKIVNYIDYMFLMTYNYHGQWEKKTGHHSGLYRHSGDPKSGEKSQLYQQWSIDFWLEAGMPKDRLVVGIPTYGMSFTLANPSNHGVHAPVAGGGRPGEFTKETGILSYYEICMNMRNKGWQSVWIEDQAAPYTYGDDQWAGYENERSIALKAENILSRDLAGAFVWSVEMDDFSGTCGQGEYPLLSTIQRIIGDSPDRSAPIHRPKYRPTAVVAEPSTSEKWENEFSAQNSKVKFSKMKRQRIWNEVHNAPAAKLDWTTRAPEHAPTTTAEVTTTASDGERLLVTWWKRPTTRRSKIWLPWNKKPRNLWKKQFDVKPTTNYKIVRENIIQQNHWDVKDEEEDPTDNKQWQSDPERYEPPTAASAWRRKELNKRKSHRDNQWKSNTDQHESPSVVSLWKKQQNEASSINAAASSRANSGDCRDLGAGTFADPHSCEHFIVCLPGEGNNALLMACPSGTRFDAHLKICNFASDVDCSR